MPSTGLLVLMALCGVAGCNDNTRVSSFSSGLDVGAFVESDEGNSTFGRTIPDGHLYDSFAQMDALSGHVSPLGDNVGDAALPDNGGLSDVGPECIKDQDACLRLSEFSVGTASRYPMVLVHGFMGWDQRFWLDYFFDIPRTLNESGYAVFAASLDPIASSEVRSGQLKTFIESVLHCTCAERVNIIAHSQGGIDARMLLGPHQMASSVESITTISSPHQGFALADDVVNNRGAGPAFLSALSGVIAQVLLGPSDTEPDLLGTLTSMSMGVRQAYNEQYPDPPDVAIYSFAGFTGILSDGSPICDDGVYGRPERGDIVEPALLAMYGLLGGPGRANDGVVPTEGCEWGLFLGCIAADHWDQIGQVAGLSDQFNFREFYLRHAQFLSENGH